MATLYFIRYRKNSGILEGGEQGSQKNYNVLSSILGEANITTYYVHDESHRRTWWDLLRGAFFTLFNYYYGLTPMRTRRICREAMKYDYVFIDRSVFGVIAKRLKRMNYPGRVISFFHNVEVDYFDAKLSQRNPFRGIMLRCVDANDRYACRYSDRIIALNPRDDGELMKRYGRRADVLIPVAFKDRVPDLRNQDRMTSPRPLCLFLGAYFPPNNEGIVWFLKNVLPRVDIQMLVVGKGMARLVEEEPLMRGIEVVSDAPDVKPYMEMADIMVLPIFKGSGMKVKTCESLMFGKNIIATDEALEGYDVDGTKIGGRCNTADEFVACINDFIANPRPRLNQYSRDTYLQKYSEQAVRNRFEQCLFS
ncbi:MAG: glycosyltransferase [Bacteroidales bacterium]|nr:glycosyltransferase [Bacteroidales bacterium]